MEKNEHESRTSVTLGDVAPLESGQVAAMCASLGWRVLPLSRQSGLPLIKKWQVKATTDLEVVEEWWGQRFHHAGVGIATGEKSGIWVLDLDVKNGLDGITTMARLCVEENDNFKKMANGTFGVTSRSGGAHLYFRWPDDGDGVRNSTSMIAPGVDVRGEGGYVRAPMNAASVFSTSYPHDAPEWLLTRARWSKTYATGAAEWRPVTPRPWMSADDLVKRAGLDLMKVQSGGRNDALNKSAFTLALWGHDAGVTRDQAWGALKWACERNGLWGEEPEGCIATFASGWNAGVAAAENPLD